MQIKVLAMKSFNIGFFQNNSDSILGEISGIKPSWQYNNDLSLLKSDMYACEDYMIGEIGSCTDFKTYFINLEKINDVLNDCPFIDMYKTTNTFIGESITECLIWWEVNLDLVFKPFLLNDYFSSELEQLKFQAMHLKMLELFRFCNTKGFLQLATKKSCNIN